MDAFNYRDGELFAEGVALSAIAERFGTPTYVYSRAHIEAQYLAFADALVPGELDAFPAHHRLGRRVEGHGDHDEVVPVQDVVLVAQAALDAHRLTEALHGIEEQELGGPARRLARAPARGCSGRGIRGGRRGERRCRGARQQCRHCFTTVEILRHARAPCAAVRSPNLTGSLGSGNAIRALTDPQAASVPGGAGGG